MKQKRMFIKFKLYEVSDRSDTVLETYYVSTNKTYFEARDKLKEHFSINRTTFEELYGEAIEKYCFIDLELLTTN